VKRGQTLAGLLVVILIIGLLASVFLYGGKPFGTRAGDHPRADGEGQTTIGISRAMAQDQVCKNNLSQIRQSVTIARTVDDQAPARLEDTRLGSDFYRCPIRKETYRYDPATGRAACIHPGHETY
jgi:hypothetical protein